VGLDCRDPPLEVTVLVGLGCGRRGVFGLRVATLADGEPVEAGEAEHEGGGEAGDIDFAVLLGSAVFGPHGGVHILLLRLFGRRARHQAFL